MIQAHATSRFVRTSAQKAGLVLELIRGKDVNRALATLKFTRKAVAGDVAKVLRSAIANAESRPDLNWNGDDLVIVAAYANEGPTLKRHRARARGRVGRILKRSCHITLELAPSPAALAAAASAAAAPKRQRAPKQTEEPTTTETETAETPAEETESES